MLRRKLGRKLSNTTRRSPKRDEMTCKNKSFFGTRKNQFFWNLILYKFKSEKLNRNIIAKRKVTGKTIIKIMMTVRVFGF